LQEASIIAIKETAEMKMIEFFIERKIVIEGAGHSITKHRAVKNRPARLQSTPYRFYLTYSLPKFSGQGITRESR
jgi:hypothetical protein